MMRKFFWVLPCFALLGCLQLGLRASPSLFQNLASSMFEECDTELAKASIPANLKLMEGLLKNDPHHRGILSTLAMGFAGYALLFVEEKEPERASELYLRARRYGLTALGAIGRDLQESQMNQEKAKLLLNAISQDDFQPFFWATVSLTGWINLNLDRPSALAQLGFAEQCLRRLVEIQPDYLGGLPHVLVGVSLSARPSLLGGKADDARAHFEKALMLGNRRFFLAQYYMARYYAVQVQDKKLFSSLLQEIARGNPEELKEFCLINRMTQQKAADLEKKADELFL
jgi:tetratricopeptide (TPR) repeat protein